MRFIEAQGALRKQTFKVRGGNLKSRIELLHAFGTGLLFGNFSYHSVIKVRCCAPQSREAGERMSTGWFSVLAT